MTVAELRGSSFELGLRLELRGEREHVKSARIFKAKPIFQ